MQIWKIRDNDQLIDIKALSHLEGINGTIIISENDILEDLNGLEAIKPPFFLDGFSYAIDGIEITNNSSLTNCSIGIICTLVTFSSGSEIHDNAVGCNNSSEILNNCIVSTVTHLNQDEVRIIPNPSSDFIKIEGIESVDNVLIYNSLGRLVARSSDRVIAISNLPKGLYFIRISQVDNIWLRKLIVE